MEVKIRLFGSFATFGPDGQSNFTLTLPDETNAEAVFHALKIPYDREHVLLVNGRQAERKKMLKSGDSIVVFPPLSGG